jgi:hypothetical protein
MLDPLWRTKASTETSSAFSIDTRRGLPLCSDYLRRFSGELRTDAQFFSASRARIERLSRGNRPRRPYSEMTRSTSCRSRVVMRLRGTRALCRLRGMPLRRRGRKSLDRRCGREGSDCIVRQIRQSKICLDAWDQFSNESTAQRCSRGVASLAPASLSHAPAPVPPSRGNQRSDQALVATAKRSKSNRGELSEKPLNPNGSDLLWTAGFGRDACDPQT